MNFSFFKSLVLFLGVATITSCGNSVTNVWDYYIKNDVEIHKTNDISTSKSKLLYRSVESVDKAQLEFIAYKQDSGKYLVIGSHKIAKKLYIHDSLYAFDVAHLYTKASDKDFIRQIGDLSIYFTHLPDSSIELFWSKWIGIRSAYNTTQPGDRQTAYVDYALSPNVYLSFIKNSKEKTPKDCIIWIDRRKHEISVDDLIKVLDNFKAFN